MKNNEKLNSSDQKKLDKDVLKHDGRDAPDWVDTAANFQFTASMTASVENSSNGEALGDDGDILAAFGEAGDVRGIGIMQDGLGISDGLIFHAITIRSNGAGDEIDFKYYDSSLDEVLPSSTSYAFVSNDVIGSLFTPYEIEVAAADLSCPECVDDNAAVAAFGGCEGAVLALGCDFVFGGSPIGTSCPVTCETCPTVVEDDCGVCNGDGSSCAVTEVPGCTEITACNFSADATDDDGSCTLAVEGYDCDNNCLADSDNDGVCDGDEIAGCMDVDACNFSADATDDDGSCTLAVEGYDCDGNCIVDADADGICDADEIAGCQDDTACDYDSTATDAGDCTFAVAGYDCDENCIIDADGDGICDADEIAGCQDDTACDYDSTATDDDGSCTYAATGYDCAGACIADADADGICDADEIAGCQDDTACDYDSTATDDDGSCTYAATGYDCAGACIVDADADGICDADEIAGCQDDTACDYDSTATDDDGSCTYAATGYDCAGACIVDADADGICDADEIAGCQDATACDYDSTATDDDGSCTYAATGYDCAGACIVDADADGICDADEIAGCQDDTACDYDSTATDDDGSCTYAATGYDCAGACIADADADGICDADEIAGCQDDTACDYDSTATDDDGSCTYAATGYDCAGACIIDADADGICDADEIAGCQDATACDYDSTATDDDGSCTYAATGYDCAGACIVDADADGICDADEIAGCQDDTACDYDSTATDDDGSCTYAATGYDCAGACIADADADGICDADEIAGCQDDTACDYDSTATDDDGSCTYAATGYDCAGACIIDADGDGICDADEIVGCQDEAACNYDVDATDDGESCDYPIDYLHDCTGGCTALEDAFGVCGGLDSLQDAIDAASPGDTILIPADYSTTETIRVTVDGLTLKNAEGARGDVLLQGGIVIAADDVTLDGLHLSGATDVKNTVIHVDGSAVRDNITIKNSVIDGENNTDVFAFYGSNAISGDLIFDNNVIKNIASWYVIDNTGSTHSVNNKLSNVEFTNNTVTHVGGSIAFRGKFDEPMESATISGNTMSDLCGSSCDGWIWAGIEVNNAEIVEIHDNDIRDAYSEGAGNGHAFQLWSMSPWEIDIYDNTLTNNAGGIWILTYAGEAAGLGATMGLEFETPSGSIYDNDLSGNSMFGVAVNDTNGGGPMACNESSTRSHDTTCPDGYSTTELYNSITGDAGPVDATINYWGNGGPADGYNINALEDPAWNDASMTELISKDCNGDWDGGAELDDCGVCGGDNSTCADEQCLLVTQPECKEVMAEYIVTDCESSGGPENFLALACMEQGGSEEFAAACGANGVYDSVFYACNQMFGHLQENSCEEAAAQAHEMTFGYCQPLINNMESVCNTLSSANMSTEIENCEDYVNSYYTEDLLLEIGTEQGVCAAVAAFYTDDCGVCDLELNNDNSTCADEQCLLVTQPECKEVMADYIVTDCEDSGGPENFLALACMEQGGSEEFAAACGANGVYDSVLYACNQMFGHLAENNCEDAAAQAHEMTFGYCQPLINNMESVCNTLSSANMSTEIENCEDYVNSYYTEDLLLEIGTEQGVCADVAAFYTDDCGVCDLELNNDNSTCADACGVPYGDNSTDAFGVCGGLDSLQDAIDAASPGDTILIPADYSTTETIRVTVDGLTLKNAEGARGDVLLQGGIVIAADDVTLDGLHLSGATDVKDTVIHVDGSAVRDNITIKNSVIDGENNTDVFAFYGSNAISGDLIFDNNVIKNIASWYVIDNTGSTHSVNNKLSNVEFTNNTVTHVGGSIAFRGKFDEPMESATISGNTMSDLCGSSCGGWIWAGIEVNNAEIVEIHDNDIRDAYSEGAGNGHAFQLWSMSPWEIDIYDNTLTNNAGGIWILTYASAAADLGATMGLEFETPTGSIYDNDLSGNSMFGVAVNDTNSGGPMACNESSTRGHETACPDGYSTTELYNSITGDAGPVDAIFNYWGNGGPADGYNINALEDPAWNDASMTELISKDCNGDWDGGAELDDCGVCGGDNSTCADVCGVPYGGTSAEIVETEENKLLITLEEPADIIFISLGDAAPEGLSMTHISSTDANMMSTSNDDSGSAMAWSSGNSVSIIEVMFGGLDELGFASLQDVLLNAPTFHLGIQAFSKASGPAEQCSMDFSETAPCTDTDGDNICDGSVNEYDIDADGCANNVDPHPYFATNYDGDTYFDDCNLDLDDDNDGALDVDDSEDNNEFICSDDDADTCDDCSSGTYDLSDDGRDYDGDGECDAGDNDDDNDGVVDADDTHPNNKYQCSDDDADTCNDCSSGLYSTGAIGPDVSGGYYSTDNDTLGAGDGWDYDGDGKCDASDTDDDNDGSLDAVDSDDNNEFVCSDVDNDGCDDCSSGTYDLSNDGWDYDGDGLCDTGDPDDDNDNALDDNDTEDNNEFVCSDTEENENGVGDGCDDCSSGTFDVSNDGVDYDNDDLCDVTDPVDSTMTVSCGDNTRNDDFASCATTETCTITADAHLLSHIPDNALTMITGAVDFGGVSYPFSEGIVFDSIAESTLDGSGKTAEGHFGIDVSLQGTNLQMAHGDSFDIHLNQLKIMTMDDNGLPYIMTMSAVTFGSSVTICDENDLGCTDTDACNYDSSANIDDGTCIPPLTYYADSDGDELGSGAGALYCLSEDQSADSMYEDVPADYVTNADDLEPDCDTNDTDECGDCGGENLGCLDVCGVPNGPGGTFECTDESFVCAVADCLDDVCDVHNGLGKTFVCIDDVLACTEADCELDECGVANGQGVLTCGVPGLCDIALGDVNQDGMITMVDMMIVVESYMSTDATPTDQSACLSDMDSSESVTLKDILLLKDAIMNSSSLVDGDDDMWL